MKSLIHHLLPLLFGIAFMSMNSLHARAAEKDPVLATVNGQKITQSMYEIYLKRRGITELNKINAELKKNYVGELVNREVLYQHALKNKIDKKPDVTSELENIQRNLLAAAQIREAVLSQGDITDSMIMEEYKKTVKDMPTREYRARHILTQAKQDAIAVIQDLQKGKDFAELAKTKSIGPTGKNGGDLGWFRDGQMMPEFTKAVLELKKGKFSNAPVKTQYGWHVILLEDTRESPPPTYDDLKQQIKMGMSNKRLGDYITSLKSKAKITLN